MVYSEDDDYALANNYDTWILYKAKKTFPTEKKLAKDRIWANSIINRWIGCKNVDITDASYFIYLEELEVEVIMRMHDKGKERKAGEAKGIYSPHDHLYQAERNYLISIGKDTGYRIRRGVRA
ncbi:hypothetical protein LCGC14_0371390 [marine sediment metagenome]|uniref:Uncharacterized protein n=1 Tax=marine sediment metagenome TaxID=412755 RepID=A0A0F9TMZ0_9ZZZZ|nr:hypothetical protein [bacterium]